MKTKIFYAITLLLLSLNGIAQNVNDPVGDVGPNIDPVYCDIFPICFENRSPCPIRICQDIKYVKNEEIVNGVPNMTGALKVCKTIPAYSTVCITYDELTAMFPGHNIPSSYISNMRQIEGVFQQTTVWSTNIEDNPDIVTPPFFQNQEDNTYQSMATNCNSRPIRLNYIKGCPGRYIITTF